MADKASDRPPRGTAKAEGDGHVYPRAGGRGGPLMADVFTALFNVLRDGWRAKLVAAYFPSDSPYPMGRGVYRMNGRLWQVTVEEIPTPPGQTPPIP